MPETALPTPIRVPLEAIEPDAMIRDRSALDPGALDELRQSILVHGLRIPIEIFALADPVGAREYGLISGFRRLAVFRELVGMGFDKFAGIPAVLREPASLADAMTAMVEENAVRAEVSPWEQARLAVEARDRGLFETIDAAVDGLYASLHRDRRRRLRMVAQLVDELDGCLTAPETLSLRRLLLLAGASSCGYADLMRHALKGSSRKDPETQWRLMQSILNEHADPGIRDPRPELGRADRPRRVWSFPRTRIVVRRERTRDGWNLCFTGEDAHGGFIDTVFDYLEQFVG